MMLNGHAHKRELKGRPQILNDDFNMGLVDEFFRHEYHDRGMQKWMGFYLSDHTAAIKQQQSTETATLTRKLRTQQSETVIGELLAQAYATHKPVSIQLNELDGGIPQPDIVGIVSGYIDNEIVIAGTTTVPLDEIRNVTYHLL